MLPIVRHSSHVTEHTSRVTCGVTIRHVTSLLCNRRRYVTCGLLLTCGMVGKVTLRVVPL